MEDFPQINLVADIERESKRTSITLLGKILAGKTLSVNDVFMVTRIIWFTRDIPKVEEVDKNTFFYSHSNPRMTEIEFGIANHGRSISRY